MLSTYRNDTPPIDHLVESPDYPSRECMQRPAMYEYDVLQSVDATFSEASIFGKGRKKNVYKSYFHTKI